MDNNRKSSPTRTNQVQKTHNSPNYPTQLAAIPSQLLNSWRYKASQITALVIYGIVTCEVLQLGRRFFADVRLDKQLHERM